MESEEHWNEIKDIVKDEYEKRLLQTRNRRNQNECQNSWWKLPRKAKTKPRKTKILGRNLTKYFRDLLFFLKKNPVL